MVPVSVRCRGRGTRGRRRRISPSSLRDRITARRRRLQRSRTTKRSRRRYRRRASQRQQLRRRPSILESGTHRTATLQEFSKAPPSRPRTTLSTLLLLVFPSSSHQHQSLLPLHFPFRPRPFSKSPALRTSLPSQSPPQSPSTTPRNPSSLDSGSTSLRLSTRTQHPRPRHFPTRQDRCPTTLLPSFPNPRQTTSFLLLRPAALSPPRPSSSRTSPIPLLPLAPPLSSRTPTTLSPSSELKSSNPSSSAALHLPLPMLCQGRFSDSSFRLRRRRWC